MELVMDGYLKTRGDINPLIDNLENNMLTGIDVTIEQYNDIKGMTYCNLYFIVYNFHLEFGTIEKPYYITGLNTWNANILMDTIEENFGLNRL
jgi:hypothetical protein